MYLKYFQIAIIATYEGPCYIFSNFLRVKRFLSTFREKKTKKMSKTAQ